MRGIDYYELLGVAEDASTAEIKSAYRAIVRSTHPDAGGDASTFQRLREAYETLHDPASRARYDRLRSTPTGRARPANGKRRVGDDPTFVASSPRIRPESISWWHRVDPGQRVHIAGQSPPGHAPLVVVFGGLLVLLIPVALPVEFVTVLAVWLVLAVVTGGSAYWLGNRLLRTARLEREFRAEFGRELVHGRVGQETDQWSERLTAELLERYLSRQPATRIFHGLALPGSVFADVDHAVLRGSKLVLLESKAWLPGHYGTRVDGSLFRNGQRFRGGATHLDKAVAVYDDMLPSVEVRGAVLIYPNRHGTVTTANTAPDADVAPMTPEQFIHDIGDWLADQPATVDVEVFRTVLRLVV